MENKNLVSVIVPVFNAENYISKTLESVLSQTYQNLEIIIVDDYSNDSTIQKISKFKDSRIKLIQLDTNQGVSNARNVGILNSTGDYIAFIDSDDIWYNDKIEKQIKFLKEKKANFCYTAYELIDEQNNIKKSKINIPEFVTYNDLLKTNVIACSSVLINKSLLNNVSFLNVKHEDYVLWLTLIKQANRFFGLNEVLLSYRKRKGSISSNKFKSAQWVWNIYRNIEQLNLFKSVYCFVNYTINGIKKHY